MLEKLKEFFSSNFDPKNEIAIFLEPCDQLKNIEMILNIMAYRYTKEDIEDEWVIFSSENDDQFFVQFLFCEDGDVLMGVSLLKKNEKYFPIIQEILSERMKMSEIEETDENTYLDIFLDNFDEKFMSKALHRIFNKAYGFGEEHRLMTKFSSTNLKDECFSFINNEGNIKIPKVIIGNPVSENKRVEDILFSKRINDQQKLRRLVFYHNFDSNEAKELLKKAEEEARKAKLHGVKRKISKKAQEVYGGVSIKNSREAISEDVRIYVWQRDQGRCIQCNNNKNLEFDHIIPVSKGGSDTARNIQLLCQDCNRRKSSNI